MNVIPTLRAQQQKGAALVVSLLLLLVMTLIGVAGMQTTVMEERMAGNTLMRQCAFESAEAALRGAEEFLDTVAVTSVFDTDGSDGLYDDSVQNVWSTLNWDGSDNRTYSPASAITCANGVNMPDPAYIVEHYGSVTMDEDTLNLGNYGSGTGAGQFELFRITARGAGPSDTAPVYLQVTYAAVI